MANVKGKRSSAFDQTGRSRAIQEMLDEAEQSMVEQPPTSGQGKPGHAGQRGRDQAGRSKATYDITLPTQELIREIAQVEECHISDIVEFALRMFAAAHQQSRVDLHPFKVPTRSLKAVWALELPAEIDFLSS